MSITLENLKELLKEKENLKKQTEAAFLQVIGQIQLIENLIKKEENIGKEKT